MLATRPVRISRLLLTALPASSQYGRAGMVNGEWFYDYRQIKNGTKKVGRRFPPELDQSRRGETQPGTSSPETSVWAGTK